MAFLTQKDSHAMWRKATYRYDGYFPPTDSYLHRFLYELHGELRQHGYRVHSSLSTDDMVQRLRHHWSGHLSYDTCSDDELQRFAKDRGLASVRKKKKNERAPTTRSRLVSRLINADTNPSFNRFLDLPPELRARTYEIYVADFTSVPLERPKDPPLTRASRLLRAESLPVFYHSCTLRVQIGYGGNVVPLRRTSSSSPRRSFATVPPNKLGMLRRVELVVPALYRLSLEDIQPLPPLAKLKLSRDIDGSASVRISPTSVPSEQGGDADPAIDVGISPVPEALYGVTGRKQDKIYVLLKIIDRKADLLHTVNRVAKDIGRRCAIEELSKR